MYIASDYGCFIHSLEFELEFHQVVDRLEDVGIAEALNLELEFHPVFDRLEDVILWMLNVKEGETVAVNCLLQLHKMLYDGTGGAL